MTECCKNVIMSTFSLYLSVKQQKYVHTFSFFIINVCTIYMTDMQADGDDKDEYVKHFCLL